MDIKRIIPCLLLRDSGFVKTRAFRNPVYLGDCFNTVRLFSEKEADELLILDITATPQGRAPNFGLLSELSAECFMPVAYGGGLRTLDDMRRILRSGFEKVSLNTVAQRVPAVVEQAAREFGSQAVVVSLDVRRKLFGRYEVFVNGGREPTGLDPISAARRAADLGAGELLLNSIDRDGSMEGYDLEMIRAVADAVPIPLVACGGAGSLRDIARALNEGGASAAAAGSLFVFVGKHRAVLITYPSSADLRREVWGSEADH